MSIEEKIREIASGEQFAKYPYIFDNLFRIDERIESTALPAIVCTLPAGGEMRLRNGKVYDAEDVLIGFLTPCHTMPTARTMPSATTA